MEGTYMFMKDNMTRVKCLFGSNVKKFVNFDAKGITKKNRPLYLRIIFKLSTIQSRSKT